MIYPQCVRYSSSSITSLAGLSQRAQLHMSSFISIHLVAKTVLSLEMIGKNQILVIIAWHHSRYFAYKYNLTGAPDPLIMIMKLHELSLDTGGHPTDLRQCALLDCTVVAENMK